MTPPDLHAHSADERYHIFDYTLDRVRNRQEARVVAAMRLMLPAAQDFCGCRLCVEDVYALAMNALPPHYVQSGSMVMRREPPTDLDVTRAVAEALEKARSKPNHPGAEVATG